MNKAIFIDKDGTLIHDVPFNVDPSKIVFFEDAFSALQKLVAAGYKIIVISNQSGIAYGYFEAEKINVVEEEMRVQLKTRNIPLEAFYYCPHHPNGTIKPFNVGCSCRKPAPGMILKAAEALEIDLSISWMVGDILNDVEAGNKAGCKTVLIDNGGETEWVTGIDRIPHFIVKNLTEAAERILEVKVNKEGIEERSNFLWNN